MPGTALGCHIIHAMLGLWVCVSVSPDCELLVSVQKRVMVSLSWCCFSGFHFMKYFFRSKISLKFTVAGEGGRARTESLQFVPRHGFLTLIRGGGAGRDHGFVLWLLRPTAQQGPERQGQVGLGRVGPRLAEGMGVDGLHRRGADLIPDVSLSVGSWADLLFLYL